MPQNTAPKITTITGTVIHGEQVGRTIGFPTANLDVVLDETQLQTGVYVGTCTIKKDGEVLWQDLPCLPYFGPRHIFGETKNVFEVYIYDFEQAIYDTEAEVTLLQHVRAPKDIKTLEELKQQLEQDKHDGLLLLKAA